MMKKVPGLILLCFCLVVKAVAQFYSGGTDPARLKWQQLETENFKLIYPVGIDSLALRYAWLLQTAGIHSIEGLRVDAPKKLPVILHPYTTRSNGFVVWAPKRMELFCLPSADGEPQNWEISLALHESRHVGQMQWAGKGLFSKLYWLMGEQSQGLAAGLFDMFSVGLLEGDAVMAETALSAAGRGRQAEFLMPYKAYFMDSVHFSLDKWHFGSQKHFIPNEYALGYLKLSAGAFLNSSSFAADTVVTASFAGGTASSEMIFPETASSTTAAVFRDITRNPFHYNKTYKQHFGANFYRLFKPAVAFYRQMWLNEAAEKAPFDSLHLIGPVTNQYVSYSSPCFSPQGLLVLKKSLSEPLSLVRIDENNKEQRLRTMGELNSSLEACGNKVYWTEQINSPRWTHESYSILLSYDLEKKKIQRLSKKSRYYFPALCEDGGRVAVASYLIGGGSELHILNASNGEIKQVFSVPFGAQLYEMTWDSSGKRIFAVLIRNNGAGIYALDTPTGNWKELMPPQHRKLSGLKYSKETLSFKSDAGGTDNIFRYNLSTGKTYRLTNTRFGAFDYLWNKKEDSLYYISYDTKGYRLAVLAARELNIEEQDFKAVLPGRRVDAVLPDGSNVAGLPENPMNLAALFTAESGLVADTMVFPQDFSYRISSYSKERNLFRIHSWAPFYYDLDELSALSFESLHRSLSPGLMFMSQNDLSTSVLQAGYAYRRGFHSGHLKYAYSGWYPVLSVEAHINDRQVIRQGLSYPDAEGRRTLSRDTLSAVALDTKFSAYVPLNFDRYGWHRGVVPSVNWQFLNNRYFIGSRYQSHYFNVVQAGLQLYSVKSMAPRDLFPRLGAGLNLQLAATPINRGYFTDLYYAKCYAYLPGLFKNQGLKLTAAYQLHHTKNISFYLGNAVKLRGVDYINPTPKMMVFSLDYALPVFPDLSLPGFLYLKRMEFYPFVDLLKTLPETTTGIESESLYSSGLETLLNVHLLRINVELNLGLRCSYNPAKGMVYEMLFSLPYLN